MPKISGLGTGEVKLANMAANSVDNSKQVFFESSQIAPIANGTISAAHGFGQKPKRVQTVAVFLTAMNGYAVGDEVDITWPVSSVPAPYGNTTWDASNVYLTTSAINYVFFDRGSGALFPLDVGNFRVVMRAWK